MRNNRMGVTLTLLLLAITAAPASPAEPGASGVAATGGFVPVAIWELQREGFPAIRHAWVAGSDKILRVSWDDGVTWFGFKPLWCDRERGMLAVTVTSREEVGRGEIQWREKATVTVASDHDGRVTLLPTATALGLDVTLRLLEVKEVAPSEIKPGTTADSGAGDQGVVPMAGGGGGRSCCVSCQGIQACDCAVCIPACHAVCCAGGCFCPPC